jgi:ketosteroid isomerase-like protein
MHRDGSFPMVGKGAAREVIAKLAGDSISEWEALDGGLAESGEFAYTYGRYALKNNGTGKIQKGYFMRVWKRESNGGWRVTFDVIKALPEGQ